jgi:hypothetical protein
MSSEPQASDWDGAERRTHQRRTRRRYRFVDRRQGFDRRKGYPVLGTMRDHPWILVAVIVLLNVLSLLDGYFTAAELGLGIASEGNPVLRAAADYSPWLAVAIKVGAMALVSAIFWHLRRRRLVLGLSLVALAGFAALVAFHVGRLKGLGLL